MRRADDRPNKASQGLGPSLSALPPRCPLCSLLPPPSATTPPAGTCGPALMGPSWTPTFLPLRTPAPALLSLFSFQCSAPDGTPSGRIFTAGGCVQYPFLLPLPRLPVSLTSSSSIVTAFGGCVMWPKSGFSFPRRSRGSRRGRGDGAVPSCRRPSAMLRIPSLSSGPTTASRSHVRLPTAALICAPLR